MQQPGRTRTSRRQFLVTGSAALGLGAATLRQSTAWAEAATAPLTEFGYGEVRLADGPHEAQLRETHEVLMGLSEDGLLKPFRQMGGMAAPGEDLGGWYHYDPDYDNRKDFDNGFAPGCTFGQWVSALARGRRCCG